MMNEEQEKDKVEGQEEQGKVQRTLGNDGESDKTNFTDSDSASDASDDSSDGSNANQPQEKDETEMPSTSGICQRSSASLKKSPSFDPDLPEYYPPIPKRKNKSKNSSPMSITKMEQQQQKDHLDVISVVKPSTMAQVTTDEPSTLPQTSKSVQIQITSPATNTNKGPQKSSGHYLPMEIYATLVAAMSFLCIGLQRAYTSPAIASMKEDDIFFNRGNPMSKTIVSWVAASPPLASFFGTIASGLSLQYLGRQKTLLFLTLPYIVGWLLIGFAKNISMVMAGRALTGLAAGFSTAAAPMYVSECVRAKVRGFLGFAPAMMLSLGILLGFTMSTINIEWQQLALLMTVFPVLLLLFALALPESPSWLLYRGNEKQAVESLRRLRGVEFVKDSIKSTKIEETKNYAKDYHLHVEIENELEEMKDVLRRRHSILPSSSSTKDGEKEPEDFVQFVFNELLGKREIRFPAFISVSLMVFQQLTGANAVIYYLSVILNEADPTVHNSTFFNSFGDSKSHHKGGMNDNGDYNWLLDPNVCSVIFGLVQFFAFFLSLPLIDRLGRRALLMISSICMILPHVVLGLFFYIKMYPNSQITIDIAHVYQFSSIIKYTSGWLPLMCLCGFIAGYSIGFGPIPYIIMSEVFPSNARSYMCALASLVNHLTLFFIIRVFPTFLDLLGPHIMFWIFSVFCFMALIHVAIFVPETKGKTLAEIEMEFKKGGNKGKKIQQINHNNHKNNEQCNCNCSK